MNRDLVLMGVMNKGEPNTEVINPNPGRRDNRMGSPTEVPDWMDPEHYIKPKRLADGSWCCMFKLMYTMSVITDISMNSYAYRWCFKDPAEAEKFLDEIENFDDIPTSRESLKGHRYTDAPRLTSYDELGLPRW